MPPTGGIARHLGDQVDVERVERGLQAHARGGHGGLASGMTGADDDYVELFGELHARRARPHTGFASFYFHSSNLEETGDPNHLPTGPHALILSGPTFPGES